MGAAGDDVIQIQPRGEPFFYPGRSGLGCLLVHGFTSAPQELRGLGGYLAERGHATLAVRLAGHATHPSAMTRSRWQDWLAAVEDGYHVLRSCSEQVVALGLSMGGALSLLASRQLPLSGVVAMSTPYEVPPQPRLRFLRHLLPLLDLASPVLRFIPKPPPLDYKDRQAARDHLSYSMLAVRGVTEIADLLTEMRAELPQVRVPVLVMHSKQDGGVSPQNATALYERLGSSQKSFRWIENSGHVMTVEPARHEVYQLAAEFVERVAGGPPTALPGRRPAWSGR